jgi:cytochrome c
VPKSQNSHKTHKKHRSSLKQQTGCLAFRGLPATLGCLALAVTLMSAPACADDDAMKGARLFQRCYACHSLSGDDRLSGPTLRGVFGRRAGALSGFEYSPALREAGQRGLVWSEGTLDRFLEDPEEMIPGVGMGGVRLRDPDERRTFIRWLQREAK